MTSPTDELGVESALHRSLTKRTADHDEVERWLAAVESVGEFAIEERSLEQLDGWHVDPVTHDVSHDSGRFFAIRGADVSIVHDGNETRWQQPVIVQPDVGILGLVAAPVDGVLHFLVQAKMEPGNRRLVQVSPTVQATASNFERIHRGSAIPFVDYFQRADRPGYIATLVDQLQSEQATRYLRKRNRNAIVVVGRSALPAVDERFRWLTLGDLLALAEGDDLLHMDTRSILGSLPLSMAPRQADTEAHAETLAWVEALAKRTMVTTREIALRHVEGWSLADGRIVSADPSPFAVIGVRVAASHREVAAWDQPLVHNADGARITLVVQRRDDAVRALVTAATGMGVRDDVELGPSAVQWPAGEREAPLDQRSADVLELAEHGRVRFDNSLPEEGGRFFHSSMHHRIVEVDARAELPPDDARRWLDLAELRALGRGTSLLNMELRSLLACLPLELRTVG